MTFPSPFAKVLAEQTTTGLPDWVIAKRGEARDWLASRGLPTLRDEEWKYTSLRPMSNLIFQRLTQAGDVNEAMLVSKLMPSAIPVVFIDGFLSHTYSRLSDLPKGIKLSPISEVWQSKHAEIAGAGLDDHPFAQLNQALLADGLAIEVEPGTAIAKPIQILHWHSAANGHEHLSSLRHVVSVGAQAKLTLVECHAGEPGANLTADVASYHVGDNADLCVYRTQLEDTKAIHSSVATAHVSRDARCELFSFSQGARLARQDLNVYLEGEGAHVVLDGVYLVHGEQHTDFHTAIHHQVANATSSQLYKGVIDDAGRVVFNGKVIVYKDAQQTVAYQLNRTLLLSDKAEIDTKPELQIDANDVKCSHGATVGQLNEDELFYLQSRAIPASHAKVMLCKAYVGDVLMKMKDQAVAAWLRQQMNAYFERTSIG